jgi:fibronectin-binding autotransporter adhesin
MFQGKISTPARFHRRSARIFALALPVLLLSAASAFAQCTPAAPVNNTTVNCTGTVTNQNSPNGYGTGVETGLTINVQAGASVTGTASPGDGIAVAGGNTLNNLGTVAGPGNNGVIALQTAADTLTVNNNSAAATISGLDGVNGLNGSAVVVNQGTITGTSNGGSAISASVSLNVTNMGTGLIMSAGTGIDNGAAGGSVTVINAGKIQAGNSIHAFGAITFTNTGTIVGTINGGTVNGSNSAMITGGVGAVRGDLTLTNSGTISNPIVNSFGAGATAGNVTITSNSGTISGDAAGVSSSGTLTVTSNSGTISSSTSGIGASSFAINAGTETTDANVTNTSTGKIMATEAAGGLQAIGILAKTATVNNAGLISASGPGAINDGINTTGLTTITNAATGTISSSSRDGVRVNNATIMNAGLITGNEGIVFRNAGATGSVFNAGTITGTGGIAIDFALNGSANPFTLTLVPGSVINGKVMSTVATTGLDTFQLGGSGSGTFDGTLGPGQQYDDFSVFNKIGSSTWTVTGANNFSGPTNVEEGALIVTGSLGSSNVTVAGGATLGGSGTIGGLVAQSGATIAPGMPTPFSTLNVTGNASFASGTTFIVNINGSGQNDKIAAGGTATLSGGTVSVIAGTGITPTSRYTILTAQGGVQGAFAQLTTTSNLALLSPSLSEDANDVFLDFKVQGSFTSVANTPSETAAAAAVQALGSGALFNTVIGQSAAGARQAFDALSGEIHASVVTAAYEDALLVSSAILDRLNQPVATPMLGAATTTTGAYAADLSSGKGPRIAPVAVQMYQPRMFDFWGQGFGDWGRVKSDGNAASLSRSTGGFVIGGDVSATNLMGGDWRFGLAGGYTNDQINVSQRQSSGTFESIFGGVYAGASFGSVQLRAGALYGTNSTSITRSVTFPGFAEVVSSNNGGSTAQAFGEAGYRIELSGLNLAGLGVSHMSIEPFAGAAAILIHQNGFTETGGVAALTGSARDFNIQTTTLGMRSEIAFASVPLTFHSLLGWRHAFGDVVPSTLLAFQGGAQSFSVAGVPIDRDAFVAEVGIDYAVTSMLSVGVSYSGQYGQRAFDNAVKAHLNLSF